MEKIEVLAAALKGALGDDSGAAASARGELTLVVDQRELIATMRTLRDRPDLRFELLADLCGVDYSAYGGGVHEGPRYAVVYHLLSLANNWRLRVRCFAPDDAFPVVPSVVDIWPSANWFEREAYDLLGIRFSGHPDLKRILLTDTWNGHPLRKEYPTEGRPEDHMLLRDPGFRPPDITTGTLPFKP